MHNICVSQIPFTKTEELEKLALIEVLKFDSTVQSHITDKIHFTKSKHIYIEDYSSSIENLLKLEEFNKIKFFNHKVPNKSRIYNLKCIDLDKDHGFVCTFVLYYYESDSRGFALSDWVDIPITFDETKKQFIFHNEKRITGGI
jgi:hypothetical protein